MTAFKSPDALPPDIVESTASLTQTGSAARDNGSDSVMILVSRCIKAGSEDVFQERLSELRGLLKQREGFQDMRAYKPDKQEEEYKVMIHFASAQNLADWQNSAERKAWTDKVRELEAQPPRAQILTNTETWEALPDQEGMHPPARHKTALITWLAIFPLATAANWLLEPYLEPYSLWIQTGVSTAITVSLMTYGIIPIFTRLFSRFLYPEIKLDDTNRS